MNSVCAELACLTMPSVARSGKPAKQRHIAPFTRTATWCVCLSPVARSFLELPAVASGHLASACSTSLSCSFRSVPTTRATARRLKWDEGRVHRESFGPSANRGDGKLRVRMAQSGIDLDVAPGTTLLDALVLAGAFLAYDCRRGECGSCAVRVLDGRPVHRDVCLSDEARRTLLCTCVSWAEGAELTLDV